MTTIAESPIKTVWNVDPSHSSVDFSVRHMMVANVKGHFGGVTGRIETIDERIQDAKVEIEIDASTIFTGAEQRDAHLKSADFLDVATHPSIRFTSTRVENYDDGRFDLVGDLTIRGVTREVVLKVEDNGRGNTPFGTYIAGFAATAQVNRHDFGARWNVALETGGWLVGDTVKINLEVEVVKVTEENKQAA